MHVPIHAQDDLHGLRALAQALPHGVGATEGSTMTLTDIDFDLIEPQRLAECVIDQLKIERRKPPTDKPRGISAREAMRAINFEALLVATAAMNIADGLSLTDTDRERLLIAWARIDTLTSEVGQ